MSRALRWLARPWLITLGITGIYLIVILLSANSDPLVFVRIGAKFSEQDPDGSIGYDGQFYYYMARELDQGWRYVDIPAYRYQRILYPLVARAFSLGNERLLPWAMALINLISVTGSVAIVETLLADRGMSRWYALSVGLYGGQLFSVVTSLAEPLALCLALVAMLLFARERWVWSALFFSLAVLAKETMLILVAGYIVYMLRQKQLRHGLVMGAVVGIPFVFWQLCLLFWLGDLGIRAGGARATPFQIIPFGALMSVVRVGWVVFLSFAAVLIPVIIVPTVWAILKAGRAILLGENHPWTLALLLYAAVIPFLPASTLLDLSAMPRFASPLVALTVLYAAYHRSHHVLRSSLLWITTIVLVPFF